MEAIIDTNILVYETVEDSIYHKKVISKLEKIDTLYLPSNILIEFILVMKKLGLANDFIINKVLEVLEDEKVKLTNIADVDFKEALKTIDQEKTDIKRINDKIVLSLAKRSNVAIYTYDEELGKQAKKLGLMIEV